MATRSWCRRLMFPSQQLCTMRIAAIPMAAIYTTRMDFRPHRSEREIDVSTNTEKDSSEASPLT